MICNVVDVFIIAISHITMAEMLYAELCTELIITCTKFRKKLTVSSTVTKILS